MTEAYKQVVYEIIELKTARDVSVKETHVAHDKFSSRVSELEDEVTNFRSKAGTLR